MHTYQSTEEITEAAYRLGINVEYRQIAKGQYVGTLPTQVHSNSTFISETTSVAMSAHGQIDENIYVVFVCNENLVLNGKSDHDDQLVIYPPGSEVYASTRGACDIPQICLPRELVEKYLLTSDLEASPLSNPAPYRISVVPGVSERLHSSVKSLALTDSPDDSQAGDIEYFLLESLAHNNFGRQDKTRSRGRPVANYAPQYQQAIDFIHKNLQSTIELNELCLTIDTPLRTLERIFLKYNRMSPKRYIVTCKLNAIRIELLKASKHEATVSNIAFKYGMTHFGRFAAAYYELFREHPRDTLAKK